MNNNRNPFGPTAGSPKKPELVEKVEEQVGGDFQKSMGFLGQALNAFLGNDEPEIAPAVRLNKENIQPNPQVLICKTCGGTGMIGRLGYEIPCSVCKPNECKTCKGSGKLGTEGFEIDCPMCQIEARK